MTKNDQAVLLAVLMRFTDEVEAAHRNAPLDKFFLPRLERALITVLEGRLRHFT